MASLRIRLDKIEKTLGSGRHAARLITVSVPCDFSDEEKEAFLAANGIYPTSADLVIYVLTRLGHSADDADREAPAILMVRDQ